MTTGVGILHGFLKSLIALIVIVPCSFALEYSVGIKFGHTVSEFWGKDDLSYASKWCRVKGKPEFLFISVKCNTYVSLQAEFGQYVKKGEQIELDYSAYTDSAMTPVLSNFIWEEVYTYEYREIPIVAKILIPLRYPVKCSVYGGPQLDFLVSASKLINDFGIRHSFDLRDETQKYDIGIVVGCECKIPFIMGSLIIDLRASEGLLTTAKTSSLENRLYPGSKAANRKNRTAYLMAGYEYEF